jgi:hypothetical protein
MPPSLMPPPYPDDHGAAFAEIVQLISRYPGLAFLAVAVSAVIGLGCALAAGGAKGDASPEGPTPVLRWLLYGGACLFGWIAVLLVLALVVGVMSGGEA